MKNKLIISILSFIAVLMQSCGPTKQQLIEYNDTIVDEQKLIFTKQNELNNAISSFDGKDITKITAAHQSLSAQINESISKMEALKALDDEGLFKNAALKMFKIIQQVVDKDYKALISLMTKSEIKPNDIEDINKLATQIDSSFEIANGEFLKAQEDFAKKYKISLTE